MSTKGVDAKEFLDKLLGPLTLHGLLLATRQGEEMSQAEFARLLGISKSHLSDIECGRKTISPDRAARFARTLQLSEAQFVRLALQDLVDRAGLRFKVHTTAA
jgi:transcriptional regulator with XRE-family HTH domain